MLRKGGSGNPPSLKMKRSGTNEAKRHKRRVKDRASCAAGLNFEKAWVRVLMEKERQLVHYNLLKILAIFMVVAVHMMQEVELVPLGNEGAFRLHEVVRTVLLTSNGLFFWSAMMERWEGFTGKGW